MTIPVDGLISRTLEPGIKKNLELLSEHLDELVNFGSHIFSWDVKKVREDQDELLQFPPVMMLRQFLDVLDSVSILIKFGTGDPPKILARALFELWFYLEYLLQKDFEKRASAFMVADIIKQIKVAKQLHPKEELGITFRKSLDEENLFQGLLDDLNVQDLEQYIASKENLLTLPQYTAAMQEYKRLTRIDGTKNIAWYRFFDGPRNIEKLSTYLKKKSQYELIYRKWSAAVHGSDIYMGKISANPETNGSLIVQLRYIRDVQDIVVYSTLMTISVFRIYVDARLPEKKKRLAEWYFNIRPTLEKIGKEKLIVIS